MVLSHLRHVIHAHDRHEDIDRWFVILRATPPSTRESTDSSRAMTQPLLRCA
jgi:hypothetical protein